MTPPSLIVRPARPEDRATLVEFMAELNRVEHRYEPDRDLNPKAADRHLAYLEDLVRRSGGFITVAQSPDRVLGFLVGILDSEDGSYIRPEERSFGHVTDIYIAEAARRCGLGRSLVEDAEARFQALGVGKVRVTALAANSGAIATYEGCGYRPLEVTFIKNLAP
jgi:ribosomal protein S18 acetylase RimI-like enzyme